MIFLKLVCNVTLPLIYCEIYPGQRLKIKSLSVHLMYLNYFKVIFIFIILTSILFLYSNTFYSFIFCFHRNWLWIGSACKPSLGIYWAKDDFQKSKGQQQEQNQNKTKERAIFKNWWNPAWHQWKSKWMILLLIFKKNISVLWMKSVNEINFNFINTILIFVFWFHFVSLLICIFSSIFHFFVLWFVCSNSSQT